MLLKGKELPLVHANMSMKGKKQKELETVQ
jgi:hypothetical protein